MRFLLTILIVCVTATFIGTSCKKDTTAPLQPREVQFLLYTDKDFTSDDGIITFKLSIQNSSNQLLWDSLLAPMRIKDIPNPANKLVFEKPVPNDDASLLKVGFYYSIENVGNSSYLDSFNYGSALKIVNFNFQ